MAIMNTIDLNTAVEWVQRWRDSQATYNSENPVNAFLIPGDNLRNVMVEGCVDARGYLGIDDYGEEKLLLVGVNEKGEDMIDEKEGWHIYNLTTPCPPDCDPNSPLY